MIPTSLKIGNRNVAVSVEPIPQEQNLMGFYDGNNFKIVLNSEMSQANIIETFWHETMHAIMDFIRFGNDITAEMQRGDTPEEVAFNVEERTAEGFAKTLLQVIQDNNLLSLTTPQ